MSEPAQQQGPVYVRGPIGPEAGAKCSECPFADEHGKPRNPVAGIGPGAFKPDFIIIGEGPGINEVRQGVPFIGASGDLMNKLLAEVGISRGRLYVTNATSCMPPAKSPDEQRGIAAECCRPRLNAELSLYPGTPALVLGAHATRELTKDSTKLTKMTQLAGTYHEVDVEGNGTPRVLIPSLHPAFLLRSSGGGGADKQGAKTAGGGHTATMGYVNLKFDVLKVKAVAAGRPIKLNLTRGETIDWEVVDAKRANVLLNDLVRECIAQGYAGIDLETYVEDEDRNFALQMLVAKIRLFGLSSRDHAVSVAWDLLTPATINNIRFLLASPAITNGYHNMVYEHGVLQSPIHRFVIRGPQEDTQLAHHAAFPGNAHRLQAVAAQFRGIPPWKSEYRAEEDRDEETLEDEAEYNVKDIFCTTKTIEPLTIWIKKTQTERVYAADRKKAALAARMHLWGYAVDYTVNQELKRRLTEVITASHEQLEESFEQVREVVIDRLAFERAKTKRLKDPDVFVERIAVRRAEEEKSIAKGKWDFSPGKDMHMIALLKARGVALTKQTDKGRTSMSAGTLEELAHIPEVAMLLRYRDNKTLFQTFVARMWEWVQDSQKKWKPPHVQEDGRVHPLWSPNKISGRYGSADPPSQNKSRGDERNKNPAKRLPNIRRQDVVPLRRRIVCFDLAQLEARLMALQSDDPFLCKVFAENRDIHAEFATLIFPRFAEREKGSLEFNNERDMTKRLEYGGLYNGSDETVWRSIVVDFPDVTLAATGAAIRKMKVMVKGVLEWQARLFAEVSRPPYELRSYILGRRRVFPMGNPPMTDIANNPNQFAGADVFDLGLMAMLQCMEKYPTSWDVKLFSIVHDAAYFEVPDVDWIVERIGRDIKSSWEQSFKSPGGTDIHFPVDLKHGYAMHDDDPKLDEQIGMVGIGRPGLRKLKLVA